MPPIPPVVEVSAFDARRRLSDGDGVVLLDCREPEELQLARIDGAIHIPMGDIPSRLPHLDPDVETLVICHTGRRSYSVAAWLAQQGFVDVKSVAGGIDAWSRDVDPAVPRY